MKLANGIFAFAALALLAGCASHMGPIEMLDNAQPVGSPYAKELAIQYRMLTDSLDGDSDAMHFAEKGIAAVNGDIVPPDMFGNASGDSAVKMGAVAAARAELVSALRNGGRSMAPYQAAIAQSRFDCWAADIKRFPGDDEDCYPRYKIAMSALQQQIASAPMPDLPPPETPAPATETFPAPVTPAPHGADVPVKQASFLAFFDWNKHALNTGAREVLAGVVKEIKSRTDIKKIDVTGYTDTSGKEAYNLRLSVKRAKAVRRYFIEHGIDAAKIGTKGLGEKDLLVPTADNVREPRNRRAEITFE